MPSNGFTSSIPGASPLSSVHEWVRSLILSEKIGALANLLAMPYSCVSFSVRHSVLHSWVRRSGGPKRPDFGFSCNSVNNATDGFRRNRLSLIGRNPFPQGFAALLLLTPDFQEELLDMPELMQWKAAIPERLLRPFTKQIKD